MAVSGSGLYVQTWIGDMTGLHVINWDLETHKVALLTNASTPNFSAAASAAVLGGAGHTQVAATGNYTAGGVLLPGTTVTESPVSQLMFDANDVSWANSTISGARAALIYADAITSPNADPAMVLIDFGTDYSTNNGTFQIQWPSTGIFTWDVY